VKIKTLLCNCKGLCPSFKDTDMNTLPFEIESELDVAYAVVHPQLCGQGGNEILADILRAAEDDPDTFVIVGGCAPEAQVKLFKKLIRSSGFPEDHFVPVDIRGTTHQRILQRLKEKVQTIVEAKKPH